MPIPGDNSTPLNPQILMVKREADTLEFTDEKLRCDFIIRRLQMICNAGDMSSTANIQSPEMTAENCFEVCQVENKLEDKPQGKVAANHSLINQFSTGNFDRETDGNRHTEYTNQTLVTAAATHFDKDLTSRAETRPQVIESSGNVCTKPKAKISHSYEMCLSSTPVGNTNPNLHLSQGQVNGRKCTVMRDPGSVISVVASCFVSSKQMLNKFVTLQLINGFRCRQRVAKVKVNTPYYCGILEACIINSPPFDLIIGNNVRDRLCPDVARDEPAFAEKPACTCVNVASVKDTTVTALIDPFFSAKCEGRGQLLEAVSRLFSARSGASVIEKKKVRRTQKVLEKLHNFVPPEKEEVLNRHRVDKLPEVVNPFPIAHGCKEKSYWMSSKNISEEKPKKKKHQDLGKKKKKTRNPGPRKKKREVRRQPRKMMMSDVHKKMII